jgi:FkbM family methyltransferase
MNLYKIGQKLFNKNFALYNALYNIYKSFSDKNLLAVLLRIISPGFKIIDIGANIGYYTAFFSIYSGEKGKIIAFEPENENFRKLRERKFKYQNVEIHKLAVGEKTESRFMYLSDQYNVDHRMYPDTHNQTRIQINTVALDDFLKEYPVPDLIKMDIQGYEYHALLGMRKTLEKAENITLCMEFWPYGLKKAGHNHEKLLALLGELHFQVFFLDGPFLKRITDPKFKEISSDLSEKNYTNILAIKGNHVQKIQNFISP